MADIVYTHRRIHKTQVSFNFAILWIDRRIPELEKYMLNNAHNPDIALEDHATSLCEYAEHVLRGRWLEAEYDIFKDDRKQGAKERYLSNLKWNYGIELTEQEAINTNPELLRRLELEYEVIE
jgi:hypothetical protein